MLSSLIRVQDGFGAGHWTGVGTALVPCGSWVLALWSLFGNVWTDLPFLVRNLEHPRQGFQPSALIDE